MSGYLTSCDSTNAIVTRGESWDEQSCVVTGSVGIGGVADIKTIVRNHTATTTEYVGLDKSTASGYVASHPGTTVYTAPVVSPAAPGYVTVMKCRYERDGDGGFYRVVVESEVIVNWVMVTA